MAKNDPPTPKQLRKPTIVIDVDADPRNANWIRILEQQRLAQSGQPPFPPPTTLPTLTDTTTPQPTEAEEEPPMADGLSTRPWEGDASNYKDAGAYADASLVNLNTGPRATWTKDKVKLPVREPGGDYNRVALGAAVAALVGARGGGVDLSPADKRAAARKLIAIYRRFKLDLPDSLQALTR